MEATTRLDLPLLLPDLPDERDACVARLISLLEARPDVTRVHVLRVGDPHGDSDGAPNSASANGSSSPASAQLCLHYDPERLSLSQLTAIAKSAGADVWQRYGHAVIELRKVTSEDGGGRIEERVRVVPGVTSVSVSVAAQLVRVEFDREATTREAIESALVSTPQSRSPDVSLEDPTGTSWYARNRELSWSLTAGVLLSLGWVMQARSARTAVALFAVSCLFGARDNVGHFLRDVRKGRFKFDIDLLMIVAAAGAAGLGQWLEAALLLFLFSLGHALEHYALGRARNAIKALAELAPTTATVIRGEGEDRQESVVKVEEVRRGDRVLVRPAERLSVDGTVVGGRSAVNQAPITGESVSVEKAVSDQVYAGTVNGEGALLIQVTNAVGDRTLDRVITLVAEAQTQKAPTQQFTERFERVFVPLVLLATVLVMVVPPLIGVWDCRLAIYRAMTLLVAASPCALALGTPAAILSGIAQAARNGVLIKGGAHLEALGAVDIVAFDKTGTITLGTPRATDVLPNDGITPQELLSSAAAVERQSQHPLAKAVIDSAESLDAPVLQASDVVSVTGLGIRARVGDDRVEVGRLKMFQVADVGGSTVPGQIVQDAERLESDGRTVIVVRRTSSTGKVTFLGVIGVADQPRSGVRATLEALRSVGVKQLVMLTGDNAGVGRAIAARVGIDDVRAGLLPEDKVTAIKELAAKGTVAMVGDGVIDAPALAHATVGFAMGGAGTAAALETADVALMSDDLGRLPFAIGLSRQTKRVIRQNLALSLGVIAVLIVTSITGVVGIALAVSVHEGSTLVVIANALRLLAYRGSPPARAVAGAT